MSDTQIDNRRFERIALGVILVLFACISVTGVTWGLPSRTIDKYLFGDSEPWAGEKIYSLAGADAKFSPDRGADVDVDPLGEADDEPTPLTATEEDVAKIYLRYRLYTYQPDEMITMMALAGMRPGRLDLDPRLYQYGGLFIYPVGALIKLCGMVGLIDVRSDVVYYLDNPEEFGKFYIVARAYAAVWGLVGVCVVFAIGRRLGGTRAGLLAALLFTLIPVVVCMAHEGKPHLPGAVLMLLAVLLAMRHASTRAASFPGAPGREDAPPPRAAGFSPRGDQHSETITVQGETPRRLKPAARCSETGDRSATDWWLMCACCGAAVGMVLSSWPIFVLIPLVALLNGRVLTCNTNPSPERERRVDIPRAIAGVALAVAVYLLSNPYVVINALSNREVLRSNFGNSLAMYEISRIGEGLLRVIGLTGEGAAWPIVVLGVVALIIGSVRRNAAMLPLAVAAAVFFMQFVLIGAGKPAEYGRFGIFTNTALAIGTSCLLLHGRKKLPVTREIVIAAMVVVWTAFCGGSYLWNFHADTTGNNSRVRLATNIAGQVDEATGKSDKLVIGVLADPAPYGCPPMDFSRVDVVLLSTPGQLSRQYSDRRHVQIYPVDRSEPGVADTSPQPSVHRCPCWRAWRDTTISWANKPFHTEGAD